MKKAAVVPPLRTQVRGVVFVLPQDYINHVKILTKIYIRNEGQSMHASIYGLELFFCTKKRRETHRK